MPEAAALERPADWGDPLCLAEGVALVVGANDSHLLFRESTGVYVRISANAVPIIEELKEPIHLDRLVDVLADRFCTDASRVRPRVVPFLAELRQADMLTSPPVVGDSDRLARTARHAPIKRLRLLRSVDAIFDPSARLLRRAPRRAVLTIVAVTMSLAAVLVLGGMAGMTGFHFGSVVWPWPIVLVLVGLVSHESAHAVACRYYNVHVREAGLGLWYYFIPIAYVDRTDAYRLRSRRGRAVIAMAGPANDVVWSAACFAVAAATTGAVHATFAATGLLFATVTLSNLNPLLPSDGHQAVESLAGELNFRGRAMEYLVVRLRRRPLPSYHCNLTPRRRRTYLAYGALSLVYLLAILGAFLAFAARLASLAL